MPKLKAYATTESAYGLGKNVTLTIAVKTFKKGFNFATRTLLHEYQHMIYRWKNKKGNKAENEFLAYYAEIFQVHPEENPNGRNQIFDIDPQQVSIPFHSKNKEIKLALFNGMAYFEDMPKELKDLHQSKFDEMLMKKTEMQKRKKKK